MHTQLYKNTSGGKEKDNSFKLPITPQLFICVFFFFADSGHHVKKKGGTQRGWEQLHNTSVVLDAR